MLDNQNKKGQKLPLSVSIISFNEEDNIQKMLETVADIALEIIIVDSGSTDKTREIAKNYGALIYVEEWKGHVAQKNSALQKCSKEWILCLDCDEVLSNKLKISIIEAIQRGKHKAYYINRKTFYLGKMMNFAWRPDWKLRLVHRDLAPRWNGLDPHDYLEIGSYNSKNKLNGDLIHYSYSSIKEHFSKTINYARISASSYYKSGKRFNLFKLIFSPTIAFVRLYFVRLGFLDGVRGFIAAVSSYIGTFLKYAFLFELQIKGKNKQN